MASERREPTVAIDLAQRPAVTLADARLEPSALKVHGPAGSVTLEPRVMQVLVALLDGAGAVASREGLLAACWGATVVGDDALHRAIAGARRALREAGSAAIAIETIPRVGYRLVVAPAAGDAAPPSAAAPLPDEVDTAAASTVDAGRSVAASPRDRDADAAAVAAVPTTSSARTRRRGVLAAGSALAVAGLAATMVWRRRADEAAPSDLAALLAAGQRAARLATSEADRHAVDLFDKATRLAPRDATAWGLLALARQQASLAVPAAELTATLARVVADAERALALDPQQPDALTARALLEPVFGEWTRAATALQSVLDRHPEHLPALDAMAILMSSAGLVTAHYPLRQATVRLDPFHARFNFRSILSHWMNEQIAPADRAGERGLQLWPRHLPTWYARFGLFKFTSRADRALLMLEANDSQPALPASTQSQLRATAKALLSGSETDRSLALGLILQSLDAGGPLAAVSATMDLAALGQTALALDVTEAFLLERGPLMAGTAWQPGQTEHNDVRHRFTNHLFLPVTAPLRADPRFAAIVRDIGLVAYWERSGHRPDYLRST